MAANGAAQFKAPPASPLLQQAWSGSATAARQVERLPFLTKVIPPLVREECTLSRPRLLNLLYEQLPHRATVLIAPAGYGKTTLLAQFARDVDALGCWCTLDEGDRDPHALLTYLVAAIARQVPGFGAGVLVALSAGGGEAREQIRTAAGMLVTEVQEQPPDYLVLVLDDCHALAGSPESAAVLDLLLEHLPNHCHLVLAGRALPELRSLPRLIAYRQARRLDEPVVRLTRDEAADLLRVTGLPDLTASEVAALHAQSQGWPVGLLLLASQRTAHGSSAASPTAQDAAGAVGRTSQAVNGADGLTIVEAWSGPAAAPEPELERAALTPEGRETLFTYLAVEVLTQQPPELLSLLRDASVLPYVEAQRCAALLQRPEGDVHSLLAQAAAQSLFISRLEFTALAATQPAGASVAAPLPERAQTAYRLHDLFRQFLLETLREQQPVRYRWLQRRAARLAEAAGDLDRAISHALAGQRWHQTARLIEAVAPEHGARGRWHTLRAWVGALPPAALDAHPRLLIIGARAEHALTSDHEAAIAFLNQAAPAFRNDPHRTAEIELLVAAILRKRGLYPEAASACRRARGHLDDDAPPYLRADADFHLALALGRLGELEEAGNLLGAAARQYAAAGEPAQEAIARDGAGALELRLGRIDRAMAELEAARKMWERLGNGPALARTLNNLGLAHHYLGEFDSARAALREAARLAHECALSAIEACAWLSLGDVQRDLDELEPSRESYQRGRRLATQVRDPYLARYALDSLGQVHRLTGALDRAETLARRAVHEAKAAGSRYEVGLYLRSLALVHLARREHEAALAALDEALAALSASGARRELARTRLYRAQLAAAARRGRRGAIVELDELERLLRALGYHGFLLGDARRALPVLEYGLATGAGGPRLAALMAAARGLTAGSDTEGSGSPATSGAGTPAEESEAALLPVVEALALGLAKVYVNGHEVSDLEWRRAKSRELFFYLLCHPGWQRREEIADALWADASPSAARSAFHTNTHRLRRAIHANVVQEQGGRYRLHPGVRCRLDAEEFERLAVAACAESDAATMAGLADPALALYGGSFLRDLSSEWSQPLAQRLESLYLATVIRLARYRAERGDHNGALALARRALETDPYLEPAHELVLVCLAAGGQLAAAQHHFRRYADLLRHDLDEEPPAELAALHRRLSRGETPVPAFATTAPEPPRPARPAPAAAPRALAAPAHAR